MESERREKERIEEEALKKQLYKDYLKKQIEDTEQRKKIAISQMSEQERKLNMKDIEAFANKDNKVHAKIAGYRVSPIQEQQKYIAKEYGLAPNNLYPNINPLSSQEKYQSISRENLSNASKEQKKL